MALWLNSYKSMIKVQMSSCTEGLSRPQRCISSFKQPKNLCKYSYVKHSRKVFSLSFSFYYKNFQDYCLDFDVSNSINFSKGRFPLGKIWPQGLLGYFVSSEALMSVWSKVGRRRRKWVLGCPESITESICFWVHVNKVMEVRVMHTQQRRRFWGFFHCCETYSWRLFPRFLAVPVVKLLSECCCVSLWYGPC